MLNWNDFDLARQREDEFRREAAMDRLARSAVRPRRGSDVVPRFVGALFAFALLLAALLASLADPAALAFGSR